MIRPFPNCAALLGLLLTACAARTPAHLGAPADWTLGTAEDCALWQDARLQRHLDRVTHSRQRTGNAARLLVNGADAWQARRDNLVDAEVILVKTFIWADDATGRQLRDRLAARARAGALVIVQYDLKGSLKGMGDLSASLDLAPGQAWLKDLPHLRSLKQAGVVLVPTNVPRSARQQRRWQQSARDLTGISADTESRGDVGRLRGLNHFDHEKYFLTAHRDDQNRLVWRAILGGLNIADEYAHGGTGKVEAPGGRPGWRDTDVELRGPVTTDIVARYLDVLGVNVQPRFLPDDPRLRRDLLLQAQPRAGEAQVRFVWNQPALRNGRHIERLLRSLVKATPEDAVIRMEMAYFTPSRRIRQPLQRALRKDRRLAVITNSSRSIDVPFVATASRAVYEELLKSGPQAALFEWEPRPRVGEETLHVKAASFGACGPVMVGSSNLDGLSTEHNSESVALISEAAFRRDFDTQFAMDVEQSRRIRQGEIESAPSIRRFLGRMVYRVGWYFLDN